MVGKPFPYVIADKLPAVPTVANVAGYRWQVPYSFRTSKGYQIRIVAEYPESATKEPINAVMKGYHYQQCWCLSSSESSRLSHRPLASPLSFIHSSTFTIVQTGDANSGGTAIPGPTLVPGEPKTTVSILPVPEQTVTILPVPEQTVSTLPVPTAV